MLFNFSLGAAHHFFGLFWLKMQFFWNYLKILEPAKW